MVIEKRQIQREVLRLGPAATEWLRQKSPAQPCDVRVLYIGADLKANLTSASACGARFYDPGWAMWIR
jgi:hypothetical protein